MTREAEDAFAGVARAFAARQFEEAARLAEDAIVAAAVVSPGAVRALADALLSAPRLQPIFRNTDEQLAAEPFYARVHAALEARLGADDLQVARARARVALEVAARGGDDRAADLLARSLETFTRALGPADPRTMALRSNLAVQYRNAGRPDRADALFAETGICEHLRPLEADLRARGARVFDVTRPWSDNCRTWVYLADAVLDLKSLRARLLLPAFVVDHVHKGTVDGAEQGLVCSIDHDAVMGLHPDLAPATARVLA